MSSIIKLTDILYFIKLLQNARGLDDNDKAKDEGIPRVTNDLVTYADSYRNGSNRHQMLSVMLFVINVFTTIKNGLETAPSA